MRFDDAIELGNISALVEMRDSGTLPALMGKEFSDFTSWYPHEIAIRWGQFEVLKWLVQESGQRIDLTAQNSRAVVVAAAYERTDILKWLILESGQDVDLNLSSGDTDWYKGENYNNEEITEILESCDGLLKMGFSLETIRNERLFEPMVKLRASHISFDTINAYPDLLRDPAIIQTATTTKATRRI